MAWQIKKRPGYKPGDVLGAAEWVDDTDEGWVDYQTKEVRRRHTHARTDIHTLTQTTSLFCMQLQNGRLAMIAISGIFVQDLLFGKYGDAVFGPFKG